jgi:SUZ domain
LKQHSAREATGLELTIDVIFHLHRGVEIMTSAAVQGTPHIPETGGINLASHVRDPSMSEAVRQVETKTFHSYHRSHSAPVTSNGENDHGPLTSSIPSGLGVTVAPGSFYRIPDSVENSRFQDDPYGGYDTSNAERSPPDDDTIDSALLAALRDSRERLGLLKLENALIDFMNTSDGYIEVGGPYNSVVISPTSGMLSGSSVTSDRPQSTFQRCILHRLADRFSIVRESGNLVEGYIRLVKIKESRTPKKLLLHLDSKEYNCPVDEATRSMDQMNISGQGGGSSNGVYNPNGNAVNNKAKPRKVKIMKRNSSTSGSGSSKNSDSKNTPRKAKNLSDREKAYAEARARIFAEQQGEGEAGIAAAGPPTPAAATPSPTITPFASRNSFNSLEEDGIPEESDDKARSRVANSAVTKATYRNRRQEENDPDFQRGGAVGVPPSYGPDVYGGYPAGVAGASYPQHTPQPASFYPPYAEDNTAYYPVQGQQQPTPLQGYYNNPGRGRGRGYGGAAPRGYNSNYNGNNYYPQAHQNHHYNTGRGSQVQSANVNSLDEFPSLR